LILAQEALDALPELHDAVDVLLVHDPGAVVVVGGAGLERLDALLDLVVPRHVRDEVADRRERPERLDGDGPVLGQVAQPRHAHQLRLAVDLGRARAAAARLAVPADGHVVRLVRLDLPHGIEHDVARLDLDVVVAERPTIGVAAPYLERDGIHQPCSLMMSASSWRMAGIGSRRTSGCPPLPFRTTRLT